jgi:hypothetical protein
LSSACKNDQVEIVQQILSKYPALLNEKLDHDHKTALFISAQSKSVSVLNYLLTVPKLDTLVRDEVFLSLRLSLLLCLSLLQDGYTILHWMSYLGLDSALGKILTKDSLALEIPGELPAETNLTRSPAAVNLSLDVNCLDNVFLTVDFILLFLLP